MADSIGIKMADGSLYPVLEQGFVGDKQLVLTTVRDDQTEVHIDLYHGAGEQAVESSKYIGSLIIENIQSSPKGDPEIMVLLGKGDDGTLNASASDRLTGEEQSLSVSLTSVEVEEMFEIPDFEFEKSGDEDAETAPDETEEEEPDRDLRGESYPLVEEDRRLQPAEALRRRNPLLLVLLLIAALAVVGGVTYLIFLAINGPGVPDLESDGGARTVAAEAQQATQPTQSSQSAPTGSSQSAQAGSSSSSASEAPPTAAAGAAAPAGGAEYQVRRGDTLWDISSTYYRNPWLYPKIAKANDIRNPDLIFAGATIFIPEL